MPERKDSPKTPPPDAPKEEEGKESSVLADRFHQNNTTMPTTTATNHRRWSYDSVGRLPIVSSSSTIGNDDASLCRMPERIMSPRVMTTREEPRDRTSPDITPSTRRWSYTGPSPSPNNVRRCLR